MRKRSLPFLTVLFTIIMALSLILHVNGQSGNVSYGGVGTTLYVLDLPEMTSQGVDNVNQTVQGVLDAAEVNQTTFVTDSDPLTFGDLNLNINASVIRDWTAYKTLVESDSNFIIVNAHGETLPVPTGYSRVDWVSKIAEALAHRNVTWVHTALYPFYYSYDQASGEGTWGEDGFKQFMSYVGKDNVTCWPTGVGSEDDLKVIGGYAQESLGLTWNVYDAWFAVRGRPLHASDFQNYTVLQMWSFGDDYPGAVVKFAESNDSSSFGFYVHIGTSQVYTNDQPPYTKNHDENYMRGYVGAAAAIWTVGFRTASEGSIADAAMAIDGASNEGRTNGLDQARQHLLQAEQDFDQSNYRLALINGKQAILEAGKAVKQESSQMPSTTLTFVAAFSACLVGAGFFAAKRRKNGKNKEALARKNQKVSY